MKLRARVVLLVLATLAPLLLACTALVVVVERDQRAAAERSVTEATRSLAATMEKELDDWTATLQSLAASVRLDSGDLATFSVEVTRVWRSKPWSAVWLVDAKGEHLRPFGTGRAVPVDREFFQSVVEARAPQISDLSADGTSREGALAVGVPVIREGAIKYVLAAGVDPGTLTAIVLQQHLPAAWVASILDGNRVVVATTLAPEKLIGHPAPDTYTAKAGEAPEGFLRGAGLDSEQGYVAFRQLPPSRWTVGVWVPAAAVDGLVRRSVWPLAAGGLVFVLAASGLTAVLGRHFAASKGKPSAMGSPSEDARQRVRRWIEEGQSFLASVSGILDDDDQIRRVAHDVEEENERLRNRAETAERQRQELDAELSRLRAEASRSQREREEIRSLLERIDSVLSRLSGQGAEADAPGPAGAGSP
jgi:hypothetical protein